MNVHAERCWPTDSRAFDELLTRGEPAVFREAAASWRLLRSASEGPFGVLDRLTEIIGHRVIPLTVGLPGDEGFLGYGNLLGSKGIPNTFSGRRLFRDAAAELKNESVAQTGYFRYSQSVRVEKEVPELLPFLELPIKECRAIKSGHWRLWMGSGNHHVNIHYDQYSSFYCVLSGRKVFTVFPPDVLPDMYVGALEGGPYSTPASVVNPKNPELDKFPRFARALASAQSVELGPGDVFYLPANWWHHVNSIGLNVSANYWWTDLDQDQTDEAHATFLKSLLSLRTLPPRWRSFWKVFFDHFIFQAQGDPYSHLPIENQGYAGHPTPERLAGIRQFLADHEQRAAANAAAQSVVPTGHYQVSPSVVMRVVSKETITVRDWAHDSDVNFPAHYFMVLLQFSTPCTPQEVMRSLHQEGWEVEQDELLDIVRELVTQGVLLPKGSLEGTGP